MSDSPYAALKTIFHEPNRMAVMSALCAAPRGLGFTDLKAECELTDGNLSRHLKALEEASAIKVKKSFRGKKPVTTCKISPKGLRAFEKYVNDINQYISK